jgi:1-phosphofructokinase family hexose kinase
MKIITITLNPAYDIHYKMEEFMLYKHNYVDSILISAGGKGINISRALLNNGINSKAYVILGKENAPIFISQLKAYGLTFKKIYCKGKIRENITIHTSDLPETRISQDDFYLNIEVLNKLFSRLRKTIKKDTIVTFSGRIPKGISKETVITFLKELQGYSCLIALDCNSFKAEEIADIKPWLIKPNEQEIKDLIGYNINSTEEIKEALIFLQKKGIENIIVSLGDKGAIGLLQKDIYIAKVPKISSLSTIGAGDSLIAGFIGAYSKGFCYRECFLNGLSFGTAHCLTEGTDPPCPKDVETIKSKIMLLKIDNVYVK